MIPKPSSGSNSKRYDRQVRVWGSHGQAALESARVCLLNAGTSQSLPTERTALALRGKRYMLPTGTLAWMQAQPVPKH